MSLPRSPPALLPAALLALGCSDAALPSAAPVHARRIDLGHGYVATLNDDDGSLVIAGHGSTIAETPPGRSLFATFHDPGRAADWHDPGKSGIAWENVASASIEASSPAPGALRLRLPDRGPDAALVSIALASDDTFYSGLGERFDHVDAHGAIVPMELRITTAFESGTNDAHVPVPFVVSSRGVGLFVASREAGAFHVAADDEQDAVRGVFEGRALEATIFVDPDPLEVIAAYTRATGLPRRPPAWSLAPMHWRNEWTDAAQLLADADAYRSLGIPASTIWLDNPWETSYNTAKIDPARFGDPAALMAAIAARGFRTIAWSTPYLEEPSGAPTDEAQTLYLEAAKQRYFVEEQSGGVFSAPGCCHKGLGMIDFTNPAAGAFWEGILGNATSAGIAGFKLDYGEDLIPELFGGRLSIARKDGETERTARTYPLGYHGAYRAALLAEGTDGFILGRSSAYGGQSLVDAIWPGDLDSDFSARAAPRVGGLPAAIVAAQTLAASGFPTFGSDTGGFRNGMPAREVLLRWAEHTAFSVIMQLGGGGDHHNPWLYDAEAGAIYKKLAREHMRLVPYLLSMTRAASTNGTPTIHPLPLAFPSDPGARAAADGEYLLGPDLLVAPITTAGATQRAVHVPPGAWIGWFDRTIREGPTEATIPAPLGAPPVLARSGALVPLYPDGIDTLVDATLPGITTLAMRASDVEARAFIEGPASATYEEGSLVSVDDDATGVTVTFAPHAPVANLFVEAELGRSKLAGKQGLALHQGGGPPIPEVADETAARACTSTCWALAPDGSRAWLALRGGGVVSLRAP